MPPAATQPRAVPTGVAAGLAYVAAVLAGEVAVCRLTRLACERFRRDHEAAEAGEGLWAFRPDLAEAAMLFAGELPNIKGPQGGMPLQLMGWQRFIFSALFGFVDRGTSTRRFCQGVIYVPRGNGKGLPLGTEIATPDGFVRMGDIAVGDHVLDRDGTPCRVSYVSPVHIGLPCYEVEFSTGERVVCDNQHLWLTQDTKERDNERYRRSPLRRGLVSRERPVASEEQRGKAQRGWS